MSKKEELSALMAAKTNRQLQDMFAEEADWSFEALQAAKVELQKRNIEPTIIRPTEIGKPLDLPAAHSAPTRRQTIEAIKSLAEARKRNATNGLTTKPLEFHSAEMGMIPPDDHNLICGACEAAIDREITSFADIDPTGQICPHFCSNCETWFHPACLPVTCNCREHLHCPLCGSNARLAPVAFYCSSCAKPTTVLVDSKWPECGCSKCGTRTSLSALYFAGKAEIYWLITIGILSLVGFIVVCVMEAPYPGKILAGVFAGLFALPWVLCILSGIVKAMMPMGIEIGFPDYRGNIDNIPLRQLQAFNAASLFHRLLSVYRWLILNSLFALVALLIGCAIIYFLRNWTELATGK